MLGTLALEFILRGLAVLVSDTLLDSWTSERIRSTIFVRRLDFISVLQRPSQLAKVLVSQVAGCLS